MIKLDEKTMKELAEYFDKDSIRHISYTFAILLAVKSAGQINNSGIEKRVKKDYLLPDFIEAEEHEIKDGSSSIDKQIEWILWELYEKGFVDRVKTGVYALSDKGKLFLDAAPYYLTSGLETAVDQKGILTGKAFFDLNPGKKDESMGAAVEAAKLNSKLDEFFGQ